MATGDKIVDLDSLKEFKEKLDDKFIAKTDAATASQGAKADTAVQKVVIGSSEYTGNTITLPESSAATDTYNPTGSQPTTGKAVKAALDTLGDSSTKNTTTQVTDSNDIIPTAAAVKAYVDLAKASASNYLGVIGAVSGLSTTATKGDWYRVRTAWTGVHVGDIIVAEKDNPTQNIDNTNWSLIHNDPNTNTTYEFTSGTNGFSVTPSDTGVAQEITVTPNVSKSDVGLGNVGNFKAVSTVASQGLTDTEKSNARANIGAGTSSFSGSYSDLSNKPDIPTESTVSGWGFTKNTGTYSKPSTGIPKTDLASAVQTSLGLADTALQSYTEKYTGTYSKPSGGIPKTDLASAVQTSLGKADTALQSVSKSDVGLGNVGNYKAVSTEVSQGLTTTEKSNARANIGAGTSNFSGNYNDLSNKPTIPTVNNATLTIQKNGSNVGTFTANASSNSTVNITMNKSDVGLGNVDNTADANKNVASAVKATQDGNGNNIVGTYATKNEVADIREKLQTRPICYGFHINGNDENADTRVTYLKDAIGLQPAYMDFTTGKFNYGSWGDAFFMPRPCMLNPDGTVAYYLDPDDYTKKTDGTASDIASTTHNMNAMMEWGAGGKIWKKKIPVPNDPTSCYVYISNMQLDKDYHAYSFINSKGQMTDRFYTPIYNGTLVGDKLRSLSGQTCLGNTYAQQVIDFAKANGVGWNTEVLCDIDLINDLLILISRSTDTQAKFGRGVCEYGFMIDTGIMNKSGMFWGNNNNISGVKVFGMENYWGNQWRRFAGMVNNNGNIKIKNCYGTSDGSTTADYNLDGSGYISTGITPSGTNGGIMSKANFNKETTIPFEAISSSTTNDKKWYADGLLYNNTIIGYALIGGACDSGSICGAFGLRLDIASPTYYWTFGAALSCKI